jgi:ketosteroid isomerase-like protein
MQTRRLSPWLAIATVFAVYAQPGFTQESETSIDAIHNEFRALKNGAEEAFNVIGSSGKDGDIEPLLQYVHDDIVLVAMNGEVSVGKQGIRDYFMDKMAGPEPTVTSVHHTFNVAALTKLYGDDTGVAYGDSIGTYGLTNGVSFTVDTYWTATMVKEGGKWLLASFQFAPSIFENPFVDEAVGMVYWVAAIAGIIGLFVGFLLARVFRRKGTAG